MPGPLALAPILTLAGAAFSRLIAARGGKWIAMALFSLGIELAITGAFMLPFIDNARAAMGGIPYDIAQWMGVLQVDVYVSLVLSAHAIASLKEARRMTFVNAGRR
jgi:membrane protein implicated in regulation of membrane protease activity